MHHQIHSSIARTQVRTGIVLTFALLSLDGFECFILPPCQSVSLQQQQQRSLSLNSQSAIFRKSFPIMLNLSKKSNNENENCVEKEYACNKMQSVVTSTSSVQSMISSLLVPMIGVVSMMTIAPLDSIAMTSGGTSSVIPSALVAYTHYVFMLITFGLLLYERLTVQAGMSTDTEKSLGIADALYGVSGLAVVISGYFRAVEYGKGWDFYSHEPMFWFKIATIGVLGGLSLFPTITFIKRTVSIVQEQPLEPMSEKLAKRLHSVINAEISGILSIPLFATLMARGVSYNSEFPWQAGAAFAAVALLGSGFFYAKQALTWKEDEVVQVE